MIVSGCREVGESEASRQDDKHPQKKLQKTRVPHPRMSQAQHAHNSVRISRIGRQLDGPNVPPILRPSTQPRRLPIRMPQRVLVHSCCPVRDDLPIVSLSNTSNCHLAKPAAHRGASLRRRVPRQSFTVPQRVDDAGCRVSKRLTLPMSLTTTGRPNAMPSRRLILSPSTSEGST